ncbi:hypothetical protein FIM12_04355 [SAR202 cluster bacterium AD-804-J14_MRT_500m]|nr:hypothetical protein [SAR202 cluster bacterium AD-804-J14_MRT_500m]
MKESRNPKKFGLIVSVLAVIVSASVAAGLVYWASLPQLTSLRSDNDELHAAVLSLKTEVSDLGGRLGTYQEIAVHQEGLADSLRLELNDSIGDRLVITEAAYEGLPRTVNQAKAQGYALLDTVNSEGELIEAACFAHEGASHYAKLQPRVTNGTEWHGAPFLLIYDSGNEKLMGMVLESTSHQPAPPWEYHAKGHPGMEFAHSSMHIWFTKPPKNLSLGEKPH